MALDVTTKDCTALSDSELAEMADLCAETGAGHEVGTLSKVTGEDGWVLVTLVREGNHLRGFSISTLERIGGTPAIIMGPATVKRHSKRDAVLKAIVSDNFRRALMAFPDEDVLMGARINSPSGFEAFKLLTDIVPRTEGKHSGEERAWGRRLVKRYDVAADRYDEHTFVITGDGTPPLVIDHESLKPEKLDPSLDELFVGIDVERGDCLVVSGWVMAEELLKHG
ncbi:MAG: hypothetical protein ACOYOP_00110 [Microthrixaceae bacterium]